MSDSQSSDPAGVPHAQPPQLAQPPAPAPAPAPAHTPPAPASIPLPPSLSQLQLRPQSQTSSPTNAGPGTAPPTSSQGSHEGPQRSDASPMVHIPSSSIIYAPPSGPPPHLQQSSPSPLTPQGTQFPQQAQQLPHPQQPQVQYAPQPLQVQYAPQPQVQYAPQLQVQYPQHPPSAHQQSFRRPQPHRASTGPRPTSDALTAQGQQSARSTRSQSVSPEKANLDNGTPVSASGRPLELSLPTTQRRTRRQNSDNGGVPRNRGPGSRQNSMNGLDDLNYIVPRLENLEEAIRPEALGERAADASASFFRRFLPSWWTSAPQLPYEVRDPAEDGPRNIRRRLAPTIRHARQEEIKYTRKAKITGYALNAAIGLQVFISALITALSAVTSGKHTQVMTAVLGGAGTVVASYLARARGSNEPELSIARTKDLQKFIRECEAFVQDYGDADDKKFDNRIEELRRSLEHLLGNGDGERKLSPG